MYEIRDITSFNLAIVFISIAGRKMPLKSGEHEQCWVTKIGMNVKKERKKKTFYWAEKVWCDVE